ncbi:protein-L-isoaspartate(D-aspartate) O-methyltransferase [Acetohalobium arabaticum]|uniref:Protein-L-isoaspartate O-methyltransferase n=1 Tax=Acetohalobium arabaticum (strain ATCC 49924 / DSM 5501 / Z-7288) TaxID=574087 RepID=D9QQP4_ACEAZ|nr:protein-L-isoaspartate(D-aspartate) O-methyltransferase [Acetohalobium arabaticum]ADL12835.1 protein-L-isoaspartate O-methyltransferase [Acetohalobium arabaticum DSM 5501]
MLFQDNERYQAMKRERMVKEQLQPKGIRHQATVESMLTVPRHKFVSERFQDMAYQDTALPIDKEQTISQPYIVGLMTEALQPSSGDKVLEIGTGSGYAAAVLAEIVDEVYTVERHQDLAQQAEDRFELLGYENIRLRVGDGTKGWVEYAPYDGITIAAGAPVVPESLADQLVTGGRLVIPVGRKEGVQELMLLKKKADGKLARSSLGQVRFVPLVGEEGWNKGR